MIDRFFSIFKKDMNRGEGVIGMALNAIIQWEKELFDTEKRILKSVYYYILKQKNK